MLKHYVEEREEEENFLTTAIANVALRCFRKKRDIFCILVISSLSFVKWIMGRKLLVVLLSSSISRNIVFFNAPRGRSIGCSLRGVCPSPKCHGVKT